MNVYIPSQLSARHWALRIHIWCFWRIDSKWWNKAVRKLLLQFKIGCVAILALTQTISDLLLQKHSCPCQLHLPQQTCRDKFLGLWGWLCIRWGIERGAHRPRMKEILRQHHHAIFGPAVAHSPCLCSLDRWEHNRDVRDRGDLSRATDELYVGLLSPHWWLQTAVVGVPQYHCYCFCLPPTARYFIVSECWLHIRTFKHHLTFCPHRSDGACNRPGWKQASYLVLVPLVEEYHHL